MTSCQPNSEHRNSLKQGHRLRQFTIDRILGQGGTGITYLALDNNTGRHVAIKEYLPMEMVIRDHNNSSILPVSCDYGEPFSYGLNRFMKEAETLAKFRHPNIVCAHDIISENNTAYIVMDYCSGMTLDTVLKKYKTLPQDKLLGIMNQVMEGLEYIHDQGFIHRDIKPANLLIKDDGKPLILDFGSTRESLQDQTGLLTRMVSPGYAPFEQYTGKKFNQGPWTDIYGLGATMYKSICGRAPADAIDRGNALLVKDCDIYVSLTEINPTGYSYNFLTAIDDSLAFQPSERPTNIADWRESFENMKASHEAILLPVENEIFNNKRTTFQFSKLETEAVTIADNINNDITRLIRQSRIRLY